jgi:hypothetical protein
METDRRPNRDRVKRAQAENYLLIVLTSFALSVILTRLFLQATGFPQLGSGTLHIAHALWGGLFLLVASLMPLVLENRWALSTSALLNGVGFGLFVDEVGKFITQNNNYFYPPAAPLIYAFFLLLVLIYLFLRRQRKPTAREELYYALSDLLELVDSNLDPQELVELQAHLANARQSDTPQIAGLAAAIAAYMEKGDYPLVPVRLGFTHRLNAWLRQIGEKVGRPWLRILILVGFTVMAFETLLALVNLGYVAFSSTATLQSFLEALLMRARGQADASVFWFYLRIAMNIGIGLLSLAAIYLISRGREDEGIHIGMIGLLLSLTGLLLLTFYLNQFGALSIAFTQFPFLLLVQAYRRWYLPGPKQPAGSG